MDNSLKDKVLEAIDIVEVIGERVSLTRKGKDYLGLCPFHADHKPSFSVSPTKQIFKCWSCGAGGDVIAFIQRFDRLEFRDALAQLARRAGIDLQRATPGERRAAELRDELLAAVAWARQHFQRNLAAPRGREAREYAARRGLLPQTLDRFAIGYAPDAWDDLLGAARRAGLRPEVLHHAGLVTTNDQGRTYDRFRNRLIFPIADALGRPIAFGGRTLGDDPAKYLNSPETGLFSKSRVLYGLDLARRAITLADAAIVVEGYMDAVMLAQAGFEHVLATLGTALTDAHAKVLRPLAQTVFLCFDGDDAGVKAANRAVEVALRTQTQVRVVVLDRDKDPADCITRAGAEGFTEYLNRSVDALEFKWSQAVNAFGVGGVTGRRQAIEDFVRFVAGATVAGGVDPLQQDLLVGRLSELLGVPAEEVFDLLAREKRTQRRAAAGNVLNAGGASAYEASIRGLAGGLVVATETVLGLLLKYPECWRGVDDSVPRATEHSQTWQRLYDVLLDVHEELGEYSLGQVVMRCEDAALCELIDRASSRAVIAESPAVHFAAVRDRLANELAVLHGAELREGLRRSGGEDAHAFAQLCAARRGAEGVLSLERQRGATRAAN